MTLPRGATLVAVLVVVLHLAVAMVTPFEIHRDELLYAAMGRHLRLFAMDFPPFIAMAQLVRHVVLGDSVLAMRVIPALAHGALVLLAARLAQDFIRKVDVLEYPELGMEAVWRIEVEDFPAFIVVDDKGNDFFARLGVTAKD